MTSLPPHAWHAVAHAREVRSVPLAVRLLDRPMVLFRHEGGVAALHDRCPHRHAPLSQGRVVAGSLQCPYHGWRFGPDGRCRHLPGWEGQPDAPRRRAVSLPVHVQDGLVWVCAEATAPDTPPPRLPLSDAVHLRWRFQAACDPIDAVENFLDPLHTHFVHAGLVRREGPRRQVPVVVEGGPRQVQATYTEPDQSGLIRRVFGGGITRTWGRYTWPGLAQLGYEDAAGRLRLVVSASFVPAGDRVDIVAVIAGRAPRPVPGWLAARLLAPFLRRTVQQDRDILERVARHREEDPEAPETPYAIAPTDLLRPHLERLLRDPDRITPETPRRLTLSL